MSVKKSAEMLKWCFLPQAFINLFAMTEIFSQEMGVVETAKWNKDGNVLEAL